MNIKELKIISLLLVFALVLPFNVSASSCGVVLAVDAVYIDKTQSTAVVNINIEENSGIAAGDIAIVSDLEILEIEGLQTDVFSNVKNGKVNWSGVDNRQYTGAFLRVTFKIPQDKTKNEWKISVEVEDLIDEDLEQVPYEIKDGAVILNEFIEPDDESQQSFVYIIQEYIKLLLDFIKRVTEYI